MAASTVNNFCLLSDDVLLKILGYLPTIDLCKCSNVNKRFFQLCHDRSLVKHSDFNSCYDLTDNILQTFLSSTTIHIESLNLNYSYWISGSLLESAISRCTNITNLQLLQCKVSVKRLCRLMSCLVKLETFAFSTEDIQEFHTELTQNSVAQKTLANIKKICVHFKHQLEFSKSISMHFLSQPSFFEYCEHIEELHILGHPSCTKGMPKYFLQPQINKKENLQHLKVLSINDAIDPVARMFFFGTLLEVCKLPLRFKTILQPVSNLEKLQHKLHFVKCVQQVDDLENLDLSRASVEVPNPLFRLERATQLRFLSLSDNNKLFSDSLRVIAECCPNMISINLNNCHNITTNGDESAVDVSGLQIMLLNLSKLQHINLAGIHFHELNSGGSLCEMLSINSAWKSVAFSPCCLKYNKSNTDNETPISGKRLSSQCDNANNFGKKRRIGIETQSVEVIPLNEATENGKSPPKLLIPSCPDVESFELIGADFRSGFNKYFGMHPKTFHYQACSSYRVRDEDILCIGQWKNLKYLQLSGLHGILKGHCLINIAKGCVNLKKLYIAYLGLSGHCSYMSSLCAALPHFQKLLDFRLEQPHVKLDQTFFRALGSCQNLERLCILSKNGSFDTEGVTVFIENVKSLIVLQLFTGSTLNSSRALQKALSIKYKTSRPALFVTIHPLFHNEMPQMSSNIPAKHLDDITILGSEVCRKPPGWQW
ncbi:F-box/LRR-repeat protein 18 [Patella vulgata]|uniref:F-box/LRR-repeat protein 18 n=1 Tax=Patella vulgata TaxID=6465 RepID=UPI00217F255A|nr:F-box/LRR-repeat protein 18 [Patella vulgata]